MLASKQTQEQWVSRFSDWDSDRFVKMSKDEVDSQRDRAGGLGTRQIPRDATSYQAQYGLQCCEDVFIKLVATSGPKMAWEMNPNLETFFFGGGGEHANQPKMLIRLVVQVYLELSAT